jgi:hypothetical protein
MEKRAITKYQFIDTFKTAKKLEIPSPSFFQIDQTLFFTWAIVGQALATGALSWLGGKVFQSVFFPEENAEIKIDFTELINGIVTKIEEIIKENISQNELRKLNAEIDAIQQDMIHYMNNPTAEDRLSSSTEKISSVISQLKSFDMLGYQSYSIGINLQISITQERYNKYGKAELPNIIEIIDRAEDHLDKMYAKWKDWSYSRFTNYRSRGNIFYYDFNGKTYSITVNEMKVWFESGGLVLNTPIDKDWLFDMYMLSKTNGEWNILYENNVEPINEGMWRMWKNLRREAKRRL